MKRGASATRVSRDVEARDVVDLALAPPRAALAASIDGTVYLLPAAVTLSDGSDPGSSTRLVGCAKTPRIWQIVTWFSSSMTDHSGFGCAR